MSLAKSQTPMKHEFLLQLPTLLLILLLYYHNVHYNVFCKRNNHFHNLLHIIFFWLNCNLYRNFFHWQIFEKICNKTAVKVLTALETCRYTTLWNINFLFISPTKIQQWQTKCSWAKNGIAIDKMILSQ